MRGDIEGALAEAEHVLATNPNLLHADGTKGVALIVLGNPQEGVASLLAGVRLDPLGPRVVLRLSQVTFGLYLARSYAAAVEAAQRVIRSHPDFPGTYRNLAAALGQLGRKVEAKEALEKAMTLAPAMFDMYVRNRPPWLRPEDHAHILDGLRKAGWAEE